MLFADTITLETKLEVDKGDESSDTPHHQVLGSVAKAPPNTKDPRTRIGPPRKAGGGCGTDEQNLGRRQRGQYVKSLCWGAP